MRFNLSINTCWLIGCLCLLTVQCSVGTCQETRRVNSVDGKLEEIDGQRPYRDLIGVDLDEFDRIRESKRNFVPVMFNRSGLNWYSESIQKAQFEYEIYFCAFDGVDLLDRFKLDYPHHDHDFRTPISDQTSSAPVFWPFDHYTRRTSNLSANSRFFFGLNTGVGIYDGKKWSEYSMSQAEKALSKQHADKPITKSPGLGYCALPYGIPWLLAISPDGTKAVAGNENYLHFYDGDWDVKPYPFYTSPRIPYFRNIEAVAVGNDGRVFIHNGGSAVETGVVAFDWKMDWAKPFDKQFNYWLEKLQSNDSHLRDRAMWAMAAFHFNFRERITVLIESTGEEELRGRLQNVVALMNEQPKHVPPMSHLGVIEDAIFSNTKTMSMNREGTLQLRVGYALVGNKWIRDQVIRISSDGKTTIQPASELVDPRPEGYRDYKIIATTDDGRMILDGKEGRFLYTPAGVEPKTSNTSKEE
jgi:hypothetical protein